MTVTEFLAWDAPGGGRWQLVDGEPVAMAPASRTHGALQLELGSVIRNHLVASGSPCTVIAAPGIIPRVRASENFRIPELAVTCTQYETEEYDVSDPVLIVEVLSPSNSRREREEKLGDYASIGVPEVWVVSPEARTVEVLYLEGAFLRTSQIVASGALIPKLFPQVSVDIAKIWPD